METRDKPFLLAGPEARVARVDREAPAGPGQARSPDGARRARLDRHRGGLRALERRPDVAVGRVRAARRALAGRLARRHARARPALRAPALRLLPRPPGRRLRHRGDRHRARPVAVHAAGGRPGDRRRLPDPLDQHVPRDARVRRLHARLRPLRPHRGARDADRGEHRCWRSASIGNGLLDVLGIGLRGRDDRRR